MSFTEFMEPTPEHVLPLTERQIEAVYDASFGYTRMEAAELRHIDASTIQAHRARAITRLLARNMPHAVWRGFKTGILIPRQTTEFPKPQRHLSSNEQQVLGRVCLGETSVEIGVVLDIKPKTVEKYRYYALKTLGARSSAHAVRICIELGVINLSGSLVSADRAVDLGHIATEPTRPISPQP